VQARIRHIVDLIAKVPLMGRPTGKRPDIRRVNTNPYPYVIFYAVTDTEIVVRRIRHMARKAD
jgi:plasmid stabilization system protein ParE